MNGLHRLPPVVFVGAVALAVATGCSASASGEDGGAERPGEGAVASAQGGGAAAAAALAGAGESATATDASPGDAREVLLGRGEALVIFGADTVVAEVARTPAERERGLQDRDEVPDGTGMLFIFEEEAPRAFWMKDTYVPLDIAYMNADLRIVSIRQMEPQDTNTYPSGAPAMFALEVRQGWFAEQGIEVGDVAEVVFGG